MDFGNLEFFCSPVRPLFSWIRHHWLSIQRERICCGPQFLCLSLCWISTVYGPRWGRALVGHQPVDTLRDTLFVKCHRLESKCVHISALQGYRGVISYVQVLVNMIDVLQHVDDILLGLEDAVEAPLPPRFSRNIPDMTVKALAFCLAITTFSAVTTGASWSGPPSSWTGFRAVRRCVGFGCCGILPTRCPPTI